MNQALLRLDRVSKSFSLNSESRAVIQDINLEVRAGEILCLVGRSGSGKSTILNLCSGLLSPDSGQIERSGQVAYAPQQDLLLPWRTVLDNAVLALEVRGRKDQCTLKAAFSTLRALGMTEAQALFPEQLSGGMRQRTSLARALIQDGEIMLFDEPLSALDFDARLRLGKELRDLIRRSGKAALFVTHNIEEAISIGDRVMMLGGRPAGILFESRIEIDESLRDPVSVRKSPVFQALFEKLWGLLAEENTR
ncbi:MAG: taurine ABC transporter ATP-binding protein [Proteobacteria bacterium]|nr:MAG: taurine ABC transporter ATP-binding protein [Pseudomonadota bacterium]